MKEIVEKIKKSIAERKHTHYGIYCDMSEALSQFTTQELFEYFCDKDGENLESYMRNHLVEQIINAEINRIKYENGAF